MLTLASSLITALQAVILGAVQGVSCELSSGLEPRPRGAAIQTPVQMAHNIVVWQSRAESPGLAFGAFMLVFWLIFGTRG